MFNVCMVLSDAYDSVGSGVLCVGSVEKKKIRKATMSIAHALDAISNTQ